MTEAFLGLGSNLGCKAGMIRRAANLMRKDGRIHFLELSPFYKTDAVGKTDQDWFVNAVARVETALSAGELLEFCLELERQLGRVRGERWGPRTIDIDLLFYGKESVLGKDLEVPHPRISERAFVLRPLLDLEPSFSFGGVGYSSLLVELEDQVIAKMKPVIAVVGASEKEDRYANKAQRRLVEKGFRVCPVSRRGGTILGETVAETLVDCSDPVDTVTLYVGSARLPKLLPDLLEACPRRVIFNPGTENEEVQRTLEAAGIETLEACTLVLLTLGNF